MAQWLSYPTFSGPFSGQEQLLAASSTSPGAGMIRIPWSAVNGLIAGTGFLPLTGGSLSGPLTLAGNATLPLQAVPLQQVQAITGGPFLQLSGGTLTGPLKLAADPTTALGAATKEYVDGAVAGGPFLPLTGGTVTGPIVLPGNATLPLQAVPLQQVTSIIGGPYLPLAGGTLTGALLLAADPTLALGAATKQYVDAAVVSGPFLPLAGGTVTGATTFSADVTFSGASTGLAVSNNATVGGTFAATGGINSTPVGAVTPSTGAFTNLTASGTVTLPSTTTGPFLLLTGGTVSGPTTFSSSGTALSVTNSAIFGAGSAATFSISGGTSAALIGANSTKNLQVSLTGNGTSFFVNAPGLGNPFVVTQGASSGAHIVDTTASVLKTKYHFVNPGALALSGAYSTTTSPLAMSMSFSGTPGTTSGGYPVMQWAITADTAAASTSAFLRLIDIEHNWGGAAMTGGRQTINIHLNQQASSGNTTQNAYYQGLNIASDMAFNEGGSGVTSGTAQGHNVPFGVYARLETGATNLFANNCCEWNVLAQTGTSMLRQFGNSIVKISGHAVQGSIDDAALSIADQAGTLVGWKTVFGIGSNLGQDPLGSTAAIMQWIAANNPATKAPQAATGIDISLGPISGNAFASRDFRVASGAVYPFQGAITQNSVGIAIDVPNYIIGYSSINNGATTLGRVGDWYGDSVTGLIVSITTLSGPTLVTGAAIQRVGYAASNPGPVTVSNLNVDTGGSFVVNVTATLNNTLTLQPTAGGALKLGSGCFTANASTAVTLTALAPAGAHSTVQEWLTITDSAGTVRYIPCF